MRWPPSTSSSLAADRSSLSHIPPRDERLLYVRFEELLQLISSFVRSLDEALFIMSHRELRRELRLIVLLEERNGALSSADAKPEA